MHRSVVTALLKLQPFFKDVDQSKIVTIVITTAPN